MRQRRIGSQGLAVAEIGLGCMSMSQFYGPLDDRESVATIRRAVELGVTLFDTADMYGPYTNEQLLARALGPDRDAVTIATKFGNVKDAAGQVVGVDGRPAYVRQACDGSLRRLATDRIDLLIQHRVDPDTPIEETWGAMAELVAEGKVAYLGLSEAAPGTVARAHVVHPVTAVQSEYSLLSRDPEPELFGTLAARGIGFLAYAPLGRGLLTGAITSADDLDPDDWRRGQPRFRATALERNARLARAVAAVAAEHGAAPAQVAIAWMLQRHPGLVPIPGTKRRTRLEENVEAASVTLAEAELERLERACPPGAAAGERYADMSSVDR